MVESHSKYNYVLQENDPPPWLHRMRELGYPPGYLGKLRTNYSFEYLIAKYAYLFLMFIVCSVDLLELKRKNYNVAWG